MWNISEGSEGYIVTLATQIMQTSDGWMVPASSWPLSATSPISGASVTEVRELVAKAVWETVQTGVLPVHPGEVAAVRIVATVVTVHHRGEQISGPIVQVPARADKHGDWVVETIGAGVLSGHGSSAPTFAQARDALVEELMLELEVNPQGIPEDWAGIQLQLTTRKTFSAQAFTNT